MKTILYITLALTLIATSLFGVDRGVEVRPGDKELIESMPKKTLTTVFRVSNTTPETKTYIGAVELPENWRLITPQFQFDLESNQTDIQLISFYIPQTTPAGTYNVTYRVIAREFPSISDYYTIQIIVLPIHEIKMTLMDAPKYVIAGDSYQLVYQIQNEGNFADSAFVAASTDEQYQVNVSPESLFLEPMSSGQIVLNVETTQKISRPSKNRIQITIEMAHDDRTKLHVLQITDIVPRMTGKLDQFRRYPVELKLSQMLQRGSVSDQGFQGNIYGTGAIDAAGKHRLTLSFRGPDIYEKSIFAEHDEYYLNYENDRLSVHVGDRSYSLSPLTEQYRYGRGFEGAIRFGKFQVGSFYQKTRWIYNRENQKAGYIRYQFNQSNSLGIQYLDKETTNVDAKVTSVEGKFQPVKETEMEVELAQSRQDSQESVAFRAQIRGKLSKVFYFLHSIYAEPDFKGYYRDTNLLSGGLSVNLIKGLRFNASMRKDNKNFAIDTTQYISPYVENSQIGLYYRLNNDLAITADWVQRAQQDRHPDVKYDYRESALRMGIIKSVKSISFDVRAEFGRTDNYMIHESFNMHKYQGSVVFEYDETKSVRGYINFDNNRRYTGEQTRLVTWGLNARISFFENTHFQLFYQNNFNPDEYHLDRNLFELRLRQRFANNHQLSLRTRHTLVRNYEDRKETALLIDYQVPMGIPIGRNLNVGVVKGRVFDVLTEQPIKDMIIRINGSTAVTDDNGYYIFPALHPKTYHMMIDKARICLNCVSVEKMPKEVTVTGGSEQVINIGITKAASLHGYVKVYKVVNDSSDHFSVDQMQNHQDDFYVAGSNNKQSIQDQKGFVTNGKTKLVPDYNLKSILVELKRFDEIQRRMSDENGRFNFEELRPGEWTVHIYDYNMPEYHKHEKNDFLITIDPDKSKEIELRVLPKRRRIQFIQEGGIIQQEKYN
ncbi:hypothetical protein HQ585_04015 [candidate division KSB1 bacterium]|nr:hypothetical protein [candidate division KSB1 bacterium]